MADDVNLAPTVDAAQSILASPAAVEAARFERALASVNRAVAEAMARLDPASGASSIDVAGGVAVFAGRGSPLTQGLAMGLAGPVTAADLDAMEAHGARQLESCRFVPPTLPALLAERGYRVHEWQLAWSRDLPDGPLEGPPAGLRVERIQPGEEERFFRVVLGGFLESEDVPTEAIALLRPTAFADGFELYLAWLGDEPVGGATLAVAGGVAIVNGSGVLPAFRRRGAQGALIRARLERARALGCDRAYSNTLPGTASRRNMERHGFSVAYPKVLMLKE